MMMAADDYDVQVNLSPFFSNDQSETVIASAVISIDIGIGIKPTHTSVSLWRSARRRRPLDNQNTKLTYLYPDVRGSGGGGSGKETRLGQILILRHTFIIRNIFFSFFFMVTSTVKTGPVSQTSETTDGQRIK